MFLSAKRTIVTMVVERLSMPGLFLDLGLNPGRDKGALVVRRALGCAGDVSPEVADTAVAATKLPGTGARRPTQPPSAL